MTRAVAVDFFFYFYFLLSLSLFFFSYLSLHMYVRLKIHMGHPFRNWNERWSEKKWRSESGSRVVKSDLCVRLVSAVHNRWARGKRGKKVSGNIMMRFPSSPSLIPRSGEDRERESSAIYHSSGVRGIVAKEGEEVENSPLSQYVYMSIKYG